MHFVALVTAFSVFLAASAEDPPPPSPLNTDFCTNIALFADAIPNGSYPGPEEVDGPFLAANCNNGEVRNVIALDYCVTNNKHKLAAQLNGGFSASCKDWTLEPNTTMLYARCGNGETSLDLADAISVDADGILGCGDHREQLACAYHNGAYHVYTAPYCHNYFTPSTPIT